MQGLDTVADGILHNWTVAVLGMFSHSDKGQCQRIYNSNLVIKTQLLQGAQ